jgi:hypothetical protein
MRSFPTSALERPNHEKIQLTPSAQCMAPSSVELPIIFNEKSGKRGLCWQSYDKLEFARVPWPSAQGMLKLVNKIFRTKCKDVDAIDATGTWRVIVEEIRPSVEMIQILVLRFETGMNLKMTCEMLRICPELASHECEKAFDKLRHPCRIMRIRNSIIGWPNLFRDSDKMLKF